MKSLKNFDFSLKHIKEYTTEELEGLQDIILVEIKNRKNKKFNNKVDEVKTSLLNLLSDYPKAILLMKKGQHYFIKDILDSGIFISDFR